MPPVTWEEAVATIQTAAIEMGELAGVPIPVHDHRIAMAEGHRRARDWEGATLGVTEPSLRVCSSTDVDEQLQVRNTWWSARLKTTITILWHGKPGAPGFKVESVYNRWGVHLDGLNRWRMLLDTMHAGLQTWDLEAEARAMMLLGGLVSEHQMKSYCLTGCFMESSRRSRAVYLFRRLRPTVVLLPGSEGSYHPSCTLCLHPLAYYHGTFAGAMVPTDEVVAHLLLMRGDEPGFWRRANQHSIDRKEAGL